MKKTKIQLEKENKALNTEVVKLRCEVQQLKKRATKETVLEVVNGVLPTGWVVVDDGTDGGGSEVVVKSDIGCEFTLFVNPLEGFRSTEITLHRDTPSGGCLRRLADIIDTLNERFDIE